MSKNSLPHIMDSLADIQKIISNLEVLKAKTTEEEKLIRTQEVKIEEVQKNFEALLKEKSTRINKIKSAKTRLQGYQQTIDELTAKLYSEVLGKKDRASLKKSAKQISTQTNESESEKTFRSSPRSSGKKRKITEIENEKSGENIRELDVTPRTSKESSQKLAVLDKSNKAVTIEPQLSEEDSESDGEKTAVPYFDLLKQSLSLPGWNKTTR